MRGSDRPDEIYAYAGTDVIKGGTGNDEIHAAYGDDRVDAGEGATATESTAAMVMTSFRSPSGAFTYLRTRRRQKKPRT